MGIRDIEALKASQAELLQKEHGNIMWDLVRQIIQGGQKSGWLSLCLPGHNVCQPNDGQKCLGNFLPHFFGTDTSITPFCAITKGLSSGGTSSFSCPSHISAQMVPQAQKMMPFPRFHGKHTFGQHHFKGNPRKTP